MMPIVMTPSSGIRGMIEASVLQVSVSHQSSHQPKTRIHKDKRWQLLRISAKQPLYKGSFERPVE
jgi:hypothetical protein